MTVLQVRAANGNRPNGLDPGLGRGGRLAKAETDVALFARADIDCEGDMSIQATIIRIIGP